MDNVIEIKLEKRLPDLLPEQEEILYKMLAEMYKRGYDDAKEKLCDGCSYKNYYSRVAAQNDCNDCGKRKVCKFVPRPGGVVRINCPLWRAKA